MSKVACVAARIARNVHVMNPVKLVVTIFAWSCIEEEVLIGLIGIILVIHYINKVGV